ncbi:MAG: hypothetical protein EBZ59_04750 [Planctomycetia bacterium]|nr:hypothetical protein [Planctomycetia bacterium]
MTGIVPTIAAGLCMAACSAAVFGQALLGPAAAGIEAARWWYPVACWGLVFAAVFRAVQAGIAVTARSCGILRRPAGPAWLPLVAALVSLIPIDGLPLGRWLHGIDATFCIPFVAVLLDFVLEPLLRRQLFDDRSRRTASVFGAFGGLLLYPLALGLGPFDPYVAGWHSPLVAGAAGAAGALLLWRNNRFGLALLAAGMAWRTGILESTNAWDYLLDPVYCLLAAGNLLAGGLAAFVRPRRPPRSAGTAMDVAAMALAAGLTETLESLDRQWTATAADLARRADTIGHRQLAECIRGWQLPEMEDRQLVLEIPPRLDQPAWIGDEQAMAVWSDFCAARRTRAAATFSLAVEAARAHAANEGRGRRPEDGTDERSPLEQRGCEAVRLMYRVLRDDPDHPRAREAGGWVRRHGAWVWPEAARRLDKGEEHSDEYGWLPKGRTRRYLGGERYAGGRWIAAEADAERHRTIERGWTHASDHWLVVSTAGLEEAARLARSLELTHTIWRQVFGAFAMEPAELERRLEGRGRVAAREPLAARLLADRGQYVEQLEQLEPTVGRTQGIYWRPTRTAWFFAGDGAEPTTVHHEATHQLFAESRTTSPLAGERCGFWAIEAAACYLESLEPTTFGWTLGGRDAGRAAAARERILEDGFHVPLAELASKGRRDLQADERLPQIYSQLAGLADFFMNGQRRLYREAFVEYLVRVYTGTVEADTLARLCGRGYVELDDEYRRYMAR